MTKKFLVTGASGFVGSQLARRLVHDGQDVQVFLRDTSPTWRIDDILPYIRVHRVDLRDRFRVQDVAKSILPQVIFHCAASGIHGGRSDTDDAGMFEINFLGTMNLIAACNPLDYECFINTGSSSEYGPKDAPMKEGDVCEPITAYGVAKCAATLYGSFIGKTQHKPILGFRLFSPYGSYDDGKRLITYAVCNALSGNDIQLASPGTVRDYVYIDDVVDAYLQAVPKARKLPGEIFNIGSGKEVSTKDVVDAIMRLTGSTSNFSWHSVPGRVFDAKHWKADIAKAKAMLGWVPHHSFAEGLQKTVEWFRNNPHLVASL